MSTANNKNDFNSFTRNDWVEYLIKNPEFADKCDKWDELDGEDWSSLLQEQPQFADKCNELNGLN